MASSKRSFLPDIYAADIYAAGIWRGLGVAAVSPPYRVVAADTFHTGAATSEEFHTGAVERQTHG